jgi:hypothetical protein
VARVRFELPNLLAGAERDYCQPHAELVRQAKGTRVVRRLGPRQLALPGLPDPSSEVRPGKAGPAGRG